MSKKKPLPAVLQLNPVAKFAHKVNKAVVFRDHTAYTRKAKHKGREPSPIRQQA
ncbi:MAG: DUF7230 family protein [Methylococcaceae bacterium]